MNAKLLKKMISEIMNESWGVSPYAAIDYQQQAIDIADDLHAVKWGRGSKTWMQKRTAEEQSILFVVIKTALDGGYTRSLPFQEAVEKAISSPENKKRVTMDQLDFMGDPKSIEEARLAVIDALPEPAKQWSRTLKESKKRGFGEGKPPKDEMYKKRQIVQEADLEAPEAAEGWGETAGEQGEAGTELSDAQAEAAEAAGERKEAAEAWKEAGKLKIDAVDAAQKYAEKEGEANDAAEQAAKTAAAAAAEKGKAIDVAKKAAEEEGAAADATQAAAEKEQAAMDALSKGQKELSNKTKEFGNKAPEFGDALSSDQETAAKEEEEREKKREEDKAEAEEANKEREEADKEAAAKAETEEGPAEEEEEEPVEESFIYNLKSLVREEYYRLHEKKWGEGGKSKSKKKSVEKVLPKTGLTADDLRGMVVQVVMKGEEDRDNQMITLLKDMLDSLRSIEHETTPEKGAMAQMARRSRLGWVKEGKVRKVRDQFSRARGVIKEMRVIGADKEADLYEGFLSWLSARGEDEGEAVQRELEGEIADTQALMGRLRDAMEERYGKEAIEFPKTPVDPARARAEEKLAQLKKQMAEVPGHHN